MHTSLRAVKVRGPPELLKAIRATAWRVVTCHTLKHIHTYINIYK